MPTIGADEIDLARCAECNAIPVMALGWVDAKPVLVLACDCSENVITTNLGITETPDCWK